MRSNIQDIPLCKIALSIIAVTALASANGFASPIAGTWHDSSSCRTLVLEVDEETGVITGEMHKQDLESGARHFDIFEVQGKTIVARDGESYLIGLVYQSLPVNYAYHEPAQTGLPPSGVNPYDEQDSWHWVASLSGQWFPKLLFTSPDDPDDPGREENLSLQHNVFMSPSVPFSEANSRENLTFFRHATSCIISTAYVPRAVDYNSPAPDLLSGYNWGDLDDHGWRLDLNANFAEGSVSGRHLVLDTDSGGVQRSYTASGLVDKFSLGPDYEQTFGLVLSDSQHPLAMKIVIGAGWKSVDEQLYYFKDVIKAGQWRRFLRIQVYDIVPTSWSNRKLSTWAGLEAPYLLFDLPPQASSSDSSRGLGDIGGLRGLNTGKGSRDLVKKRK